MDDPTASAVVEELARLTNHTITIVTASSQAIQQSMRRLLRSGASNRPTPSPGRRRSRMRRTRARPSSLDEPCRTRRVDDPLHQIITLALEIGASDIHLEAAAGTRSGSASTAICVRPIPRRCRARRRSRCASCLGGSGRSPGSTPPIACRSTAGSRSSTPGTRAPIGVRVSILPSAAGDSVVIRIADRARAPKGLADLHLSQAVTTKLEKALAQKGGGLFLVTGPAGSGRSTTLAACVASLSRPDMRILVVDEPGELAPVEVSRFDVRDEPGQTYADYLRVVLRHDPDVVMIGEIADRETADLACRARRVGPAGAQHAPHRYARSPPCRDSSASGVDPALLAPVLRGVMSQRLIRKTGRQDRPHADRRVLDARRRGSPPDPQPARRSTNLRRSCRAPHAHRTPADPAFALRASARQCPI